MKATITIFSAVCVFFLLKSLSILSSHQEKDDWESALEKETATDEALHKRPRKPFSSQRKREMNSRLEDTWPRTQSLLAEACDGEGECNPPATLQEIEELEDKLGFRLPSELSRFLAMSNGQKKGHCFFEEKYLLGTYDLFAMYREMPFIEDEGWGGYSFDDDEGEVQLDKGWRAEWIPFLVSVIGSSTFCIDQSPGPEGIVGQVIEVDYVNAEIVLVADSLTEFFERIALMLEEKEYLFDDGFLELEW